MDKNDYQKFSSAQIGEMIKRPALVAAIAEARDKNNNPFVRITLKDGFSEIMPNMFKTNISALSGQGIVEGCVADTVVSVSEYNGAKSYRIERISLCTDPNISATDFMKLPPIDVEVMYNEICSIIKAAADDMNGNYLPISDLALTILSDKKSRYITSSAAISMHHNMRGGLIYHSYRMVKAADALCSVYPTLNRELLVCGAALHDIGKIWEYNTDTSGEAAFTSSGVLFGHLYLGASLIKKYTEGKNYNSEKVKLLTHMILSHHGTREFGAVVCPAASEAFALFYIDNLDAKLYACEDHYETIDPGSITDKKPFGLDNRIYRPQYWSSDPHTDSM
ncbi:MAG: HD domain-containing protein [Clostridia bacterium]|nr:HD domain-containing protein [Clostridia bacterium]